MSEVVIRSANPPAAGQMLSPWRMTTGMVRHWDLIWKFAARDIVEMYKGSYLGLVWVIAQPLLILGVYTFVFSAVLEAKDWMGGGDEVGTSGRHAGFALMFFTGHLLYQFFSNVVQKSPTLLIGRRNLVQRVVFPVEILPVASALSALVYALIAIALLLIAAAAFAGIVNWTVLLLPAVLAPLVMLSLGLSWILASLGVFIRDTRVFTEVVVSLLYFMTPIFYTIDAVPDDYKWVLRLNPMSTIVTSGRDVLLLGQAPDWQALGIVTVASVLVMQIGYFWFMRTKRVFADVI